MDGFVIYDFKIDVWQPKTLPLERLAEYATELAKLLGSTPDVHLLGIRAGSHVQAIAVADRVHRVVGHGWIIWSTRFPRTEPRC